MTWSISASGTAEQVKTTLDGYAKPSGCSEGELSTFELARETLIALASKSQPTAKSLSVSAFGHGEAVTSLTLNTYY